MPTFTKIPNESIIISKTEIDVLLYFLSQMEPVDKPALLVAFARGIIRTYKSGIKNGKNKEKKKESIIRTCKSGIKNGKTEEKKKQNDKEKIVRKVEVKSVGPLGIRSTS